MLNLSLKLTKRTGVIIIIGFVLIIAVVCLKSFVKTRYIFIDGGAHLGETIEHFVKSDIYKEHDWEMISFEANPNIASQIPPRSNLTVLSKAIWTNEDGIEFYIAEYSPSSSIIKDKKTGNLSKVPVLVESVDFGQWLKQNFSLKDYILVKLDIEGAEYDVLEKMLKDGTMKYVDFLFVEFHNVKVDVPVQKDDELIKKILKLNIPIRVNPNQREHGDWFED